MVVLLFGSKSHVTWLELKDFAGNVQAKKHKKFSVRSGGRRRGLTSQGNFRPFARAAFHN
jgi:hypothetical protein